MLHIRLNERLSNRLSGITSARYLFSAQLRKRGIMSIARTIDWLDMRRDAVNLFLIGFLILFLELACIRWFSANVVFLQFFTNIVLIACFLGMSCGCLAARKRWDWLASFPLVGPGTFTAAPATIWVYNYWGGLAGDVGHQALPQEGFFGTEDRDPDLAKFALPI